MLSLQNIHTISEEKRKRRKAPQAKGKKKINKRVIRKFYNYTFT